MSRVAVRPAASIDVEVEIGEVVFHPVVVTRTRGRQIAELDRAFYALLQRAGDPDLPPGEFHDGQVDLIGQMLDVWLAPSPGKRKKPSTVIDAMWKAEDITLSQLLGLLEDIAGAVGRPT